MILSYSEFLEKLAKDQSSKMAQGNTLSHDYPKPFSERIQEGGYNNGAGENIQVTHHPYNINEIVDAWMNSPGHRANIMNDSYSEEGIGTYDMGKGTFITQIFGCGQSCCYNIGDYSTYPLQKKVYLVQDDGFLEIV